MKIYMIWNDIGRERNVDLGENIECEMICMFCEK